MNTQTTHIVRLNPKLSEQINGVFTDGISVGDGNGQRDGLGQVDTRPVAQVFCWFSYQASKRLKTQRTGSTTASKGMSGGEARGRKHGIGRPKPGGNTITGNTGIGSTGMSWR